LFDLAVTPSLLTELLERQAIEKINISNSLLNDRLPLLARQKLFRIKPRVKPLYLSTCYKVALFFLCPLWRSKEKLLFFRSFKSIFPPFICHT